LRAKEFRVQTMSQITRQVPALLRSIRLSLRANVFRRFETTVSHERISPVDYLEQEEVKVFVPGQFFVFTVFGAVILFGLAFYVVYIFGSW
jgi:hypothetical protein